MGAVIAVAVALKANLPAGIYQIVYLILTVFVGGTINMLPVIINRYTNISPTVLVIIFRAMEKRMGKKMIII